MRPNSSPRIMLTTFLNSLKSLAPDHLKARFLLTVSGGMDSMLMLHLFEKAKLDFSVAHCNFNLRGEDSENDALSVIECCLTKSLRIHVIEFQTQLELEKDEKHSLQMLARKLRYAWFERLSLDQNYDYIVTAHHANDSLETLFYNLITKTGIKGLTGIPARNGKIIRPLQKFTKSEIQNYVNEQQIKYREDASNKENKYNRNKLRNKLMPVLESINPAYEKNIIESIENLKSAEKIYRFAIDMFRRQVSFQKDAYLEIDLVALKKIPEPKTVLYEILKDKEFSQDNINKILAIEFGTGQLFESDKAEAVLQKEKILVYDLSPPIPNQNVCFKDKTWKFGQHTIQLHLKDWNQNEEFIKSNEVAQIDLDKIIEPLVIRSWQEGDKFQPFGMNGKHQKLQDFFNNIGINRIEKKKVPLLCSGVDIVWVIGHRIDERFRIDSDTKKVLVLSLKTT